MAEQRRPLSLRTLVSQADGKLQGEILSANHLPGIGSPDEFYAVLVQCEAGEATDTVIVAGAKPEAGEKFEFTTGDEGFPVGTRVEVQA
jgi:hypothetical protein